MRHLSAPVRQTGGMELPPGWSAAMDDYFAAKLELFQLRGFIPPDLCRELIDLIDANRRPSTIADPVSMRRMRRPSIFEALSIIVASGLSMAARAAVAGVLDIASHVDRDAAKTSPCGQARAFRLDVFRHRLNKRRDG